VKKIIIKYISGGNTLYLSFSLEDLTQFIAEEDYCRLYFNTVFNMNTLGPGLFYYGTYVNFYKIGQGYNLYSQILNSVSEVFTNPKSASAVLDFTWDPDTSFNYSNMMGTI